MDVPPTPLAYPLKRGWWVARGFAYPQGWCHLSATHGNGVRLRLAVAAYLLKRIWAFVLED